MKRIIKVALLALISVALYACVPQADSGNNPLPSFAYSPFGARAVTTSLEDALPRDNWIDVSNIKPETENIDINQAGYYRYDTRSYCLHAGKNGASRGKGYLIAPLKGSQADFIASIVKNSDSNRDIAQHDIQRIIWAIEAGTSLKNFSGQQKIALLRLASPEDLAKYELAIQADANNLSGIARSLLPQDVRNALDFYDRFNSLVTDVNATYADIERMAVLSGIAPSGPNDVVINEGNWARIGENLFIRVFPKAYYRTTVEVLKLAASNIKKDEYGRIVVFESGNYRQEVSYKDSLNFVTAPDGKKYPYWEIKKIKLMGPGQNDVFEIENAGWIIPSDIVIDESSLGENSASRDILAQDTQWNKYRKRMEQVKKWREKYKGFNEKWETATKDLSEEDFRNVTDIKHYEEGLKAGLTGSPADKASWLDKHLSIVVRAWQYAICKLAGSCDNKNPTNPVGTPGNRGHQRLLIDYNYGQDSDW